MKQVIRRQHHFGPSRPDDEDAASSCVVVPIGFSSWDALRLKPCPLGLREGVALMMTMERGR